MKYYYRYPYCLYCLLIILTYYKFCETLFSWEVIKKKSKIVRKFTYISTAYGS